MVGRVWGLDVLGMAGCVESEPLSIVGVVGAAKSGNTDTNRYLSPVIMDELGGD